MSTPSVSNESAASTQEQHQFRAFATDDGTRKIIQQVVAELAIPNASIHHGGVREATHYLGERRSPRLLMVDLSGVELPLSAVNELAEVCEPGVTLIATGERNDVGLFRDLINNGVSDYLVKPVTVPLLRKSLLSATDGKASGQAVERRGRLIAVIGSRGGVGTTMLATSIGWTIAQRRRRRVALMELDLQQGTVALALDLEPAHGLLEALEHPERIDGLFLERTMAHHSETFHVLSGEESISEPISVPYSWLKLIIDEMRNKYHYVVVDANHHITAGQKYILQFANNIVITTDLSVAGMRDTLRHVTEAAARNSTSQIHIVVNRLSASIEGGLGIKEFETAIGRNVDFTIPFDPRSVANSMNAGRPVAQGRGKVPMIIQRIAEQVAGSSPAPSAPRRLRLWPLTWR